MLNTPSGKKEAILKARRIVESILYEIEYFSNLDYEEEIEMDIRDFTKYLLTDVNLFLSKVCSADDDDYKRGIIISTLVKNGIDLDKIEDRIKYDCVRRSTVVDLIKGEGDWEYLEETSTYSSMDTEYLHFNFYELYLNADNFKGTQEELINVLARLKKLGYIYILVTKKQRISTKLRETVYGVIKVK